jgi:1-acyl-sn-glycerol-3-phosphate acyltransferase
MILSVIFVLISIASTLGLYFGLSLYKNWIYFWVIPVGLIVFFIAAFGLSVIYLIVNSLFMSSTKPIKKPSKYCLRWLQQYCFQFLFWMNVHTKYVGFKEIDKKKNYLYIYNHKSNFDPIMLISKVRGKDLLCITKPENMKIFVCGKFLHNAGYLPIDRQNDFNAIKTIIQATKIVESGQASISIAPEGTRNKTDKILLPFHPGALKIAQKGGCDIVVVGIKGAEKIKKHRIIIPTKCEAKVLTIIKNEDIVKNGTVAISEKLEGIYKGYLEK